MIGVIRQIMGFDGECAPVLEAEDVCPDVGACQKEYDHINNLLAKFESLSREELIQVKAECSGFEDFINGLTVMLTPLKRCVDLEKRFPLVKRDMTFTRKVKWKSGSSEKILDVRGIWTSMLPAKPFTSFDMTVEGSKYTITSKTPAPTAEATAAMHAHKHEFDHLELWWVPKDITIQKIPKPDPILVGAVEFKPKHFRFFELHRWIDESVESAWWSREGY